MFVPLARIPRRGIAALAGIVMGLAITGCATSYAVPGGPADLKKLGMTREALTDATIKQALATQPLATFPCKIIAARIQAPGYHSETAETFGAGNYCVITTRDIESESSWNKLQKLPMCTGISPISRLVLSNKLDTDVELRQAAAALHADILLIYTIDTSFRVEDHLLPLSVVTLGLSPNDTVEVITTASAVLMDTRNGYLYGYSEATEKGTQLANGWTATQAISTARLRTEGKAFDKLVAGLQVTWADVIAHYGPTPKTTAVRE